MIKTGLIFLGPPGAGKGTQAQMLAKLLQIPHISTGEILRGAIAQGTTLGQKAQAYVDQGELVPDELILNLIRERLRQQDVEPGWILDGFPRNVAQATFLDQLLEEIDQNGVAVVNLEVPDGVLIERLLSRGRKDDTEETIRRRLEVYREKTTPLIDYYSSKNKLHSVNGDRPPESVSNSIKQLIS
ncbi:MAG: adenylate kinase [Cyanophyceae cyanobacterium]